MRKMLMFCLILILASGYALGWEGTDSDTGGYIEIEKGNLVRSGNEIEIYDQNDGCYHDVEVESIDRYGSNVEIEVYDWNTSEYRTFEMED